MHNPIDGHFTFVRPGEQYRVGIRMPPKAPIPIHFLLRHKIRHPVGDTTRLGLGRPKGNADRRCRGGRGRGPHGIIE